MSQAAIRRMIKENVDAVIAVERARHANVGNNARGSGPVKEGKKVKFAAATLQGPALSWWNAKLTTIGLETVNQIPWTVMKQLITAEFCPIEEIQRMEDKLWNLKVKEYNIVAYTQRFNELALMCPRMVEPERVKVDAYIRGLTDNIKGKVTSSRPANLSEANNQRQGNAQAMVTAPSDGWLPLCERCFTRHVGQCTIQCHKCGKVGYKSTYCKEKNVATGANALPIPTFYDCGEKGHTRNQCPKKVKQEEVREVRGRAYAFNDAEPKDPIVVTSTFLLDNRYSFVLFDSGSNRSFVDSRFSSMLDIDPIKIEASYEVELADERVVSRNTVLKGCTLNLVNHVFKIDLMPINLGTFDVIIGKDWLVKHDAVIVCGERVVRIPYGNKIKKKKKIEEEQVANARYWKIPACCDDDDDYNSAITPNEPIDSLNMGDEHLNTIPATKSDEFIKSSVENLVPNLSESEGKNGCDVPACFTTFSNILFDADYEFDSVNDQSLSDEAIPKKIFSNPFFEEEIIPMKIDQHHFNAESNLIESMLNHDSSIIPSSSKIDSLLDEFTGELLFSNQFRRELIKLIVIMRMKFVLSRDCCTITHLPDSDSFMEEIDLSFTTDDPMPPGIEEDDDDCERDILIREELLDN
nr:hypothetical protein [Tanacetum cinerariifolium]